MNRSGWRNGARADHRARIARPRNAAKTFRQGEAA